MKGLDKSSLACSAVFLHPALLEPRVLLEVREDDYFDEKRRYEGKRASSINSFKFP
jgi:hypothetical protein